MYKRCTHLVNGGDVAVFIDAMSQRPCGWRIDEDNRVWIMIPDMIDMAIELSKEAVEILSVNKRMLVIEVAENGNFETWVETSYIDEIDIEKTAVDLVIKN